ncbi:MAG: hypothetical protein IT499_07765 [Rubrivivax sp.]|jgi:hypothetical protein|nr:hypothetical protein [Rubrivivax sp.]MCL4695920.1 hypothetical protein [Burkholderiaceae bacterium]
MHTARFQPARRPIRLAHGLAGALVGLAVVSSIAHGLGARSGGQSLGQYVATQRAIAQQPMARATVPTTPAAPVSEVARDAV